MISFTMLRYFESSTAEMAEASGFDRILVLHDKVEAIRLNEEIGVKFMNEWEEKMMDRQAAFEAGEARLIDAFVGSLCLGKYGIKGAASEDPSTYATDGFSSCTFMGT